MSGHFPAENRWSIWSGKPLKRYPIFGGHFPAESGGQFVRILQLDDNETLISLRLKGRQRVWGIRILSVLNLLWWDPEHEVFHSEKKHT